MEKTTLFPNISFPGLDEQKGLSGKILHFFSSTGMITPAILVLQTPDGSEKEIFLHDKGGFPAQVGDRVDLLILDTGATDLFEYMVGDVKITDENQQNIEKIGAVCLAERALSSRLQGYTDR